MPGFTELPDRMPMPPRKQICIRCGNPAWPGFLCEACKLLPTGLFFGWVEEREEDGTPKR
jgi:hypothetical protein